jgi:general secretion pathway protein A
MEVRAPHPAHRLQGKIMYLEFFGLAEKPFNLTPNPRFIFLSKNHKEVFAHLLFGIRTHSGFIEVTGEVGAGKTTVLRTLFEQLEGDYYRLAFIFNPSLSAEELLRAICRELNIEVTGASNGEIIEALNAYLLRENHAGRTVVLVIDEAQNLTPPVLEQIRLLSNLETAGDKLIQIILVGQPELGDLLDRSDLRQLKQRIAVRYHLRPIDLEETRAYIRHRLELVGVHDRELFSPAAERRIFRFSGGLPRLINVLCDRALLVAYSEDLRRVTLAEVRTAIAELRRRQPSRRRWPLVGVGGALALVLGMALVSTAPVIDKSAALPPKTLAGIRQPVPPLPAPVTPGGGAVAARPASDPGPGPTPANSRQPAAAGRHQGGAPLVLGLVPAAGPLGSPAQAERLAAYLEERVGEPVRIEIFNNENGLYEGVYRYRQVDLAWFRGRIPAHANHLPLQPLVAWQGEDGRQAAEGLLVARRGLGAGPLKLLRSALLDMGGKPKGRTVLEEAGGITFRDASPPAGKGNPRLTSKRQTAGGGKP